MSDPNTAPPQDDPDVTRLRAAIRRLRRREVVLLHKLAVAQWKLARLEARRSTRLVAALGTAARDPRQLIRLPWTLLSILLRSQPLPPRPQESEAVAAAEAALARTPPPRPAGAPPPRQRPRLSAPDLDDRPFPEGPVRRPGLRIATILDEFSARSWAYEADLTALRPGDWRRTLDEVQPHLLFVESAWRGVDDEWRHHLTPPTPPSAELVELVETCRQREIPTVFWNKEDPPNFELFIDSAALFDVVLTVDEGSIPRYRERLGHDRLAVLPFGAQPRIHNPLLPAEGRDHAVAFAGTYYVDKHPHRKVQMMQVLEPARAFGLHIYARFGNAEAYRFPPRLDEHVVGRLTYGQTLAAYRRYRIFLNVNSAPKSATMCARRIFEVLACGATVVSGVSPAIGRLLGPDVVDETDDPDRTTELLTRLLDVDDDAYARASARGVRTVLSEHTYGHRLTAILEHADLTAHDVPAARLAAVVPCRDHRAARRLLGDLSRQRRRPDTVVLVGTRDVVASLEAEAGAAGSRVLPHDGDPGDLVAAARGLDADLVALLDDRTRYGPGYLLDQELATRYVEGPAVVKAAHHVARRGGLELVDRDAEHRPTRAALAGSLVVHRASLADVPTGTRHDDLIGALGGTVVATSRFEIVPPDPATGAVADDEAVTAASL